LPFPCPPKSLPSSVCHRGPWVSTMFLWGRQAAYDGRLS
jgi:hypothetical protein